MIDRAALGIAYREVACDALASAGWPVVADPHVVDGPQCAVVTCYTPERIPARALPDLADAVSFALDVPGVQLRRTGQTLTVEVPWPDRRMIPAAKMRAAGWRLELGITPAGERVTVDLTDCAHLLIAGRTGSGKSELLRTVAVLLARAHAPEQLPIVMIDRDAGHVQAAFTPLARLAHLAHPVASTAREACAALEWVVRERIDGDAGPCAVLVDEASWLRKDKRCADALTQIAERGRKRDVHLVLAAQRSVTTSVVRDVVVEFGAVACGLVRDWRESQSAIGTSDACRLLGAGDMLIRVGGAEVVRFQAAATAPEDVAGLAMGTAAPADLTTEGDDDTATLAWAIQTGRERRRGGTVATAAAIRERVGCGTDEARRLRDLAQAVSTYLPGREGPPGGQNGGSAAMAEKGR